MQIQTARESRAALETDAALRFSSKGKFKLESRHSEPVIAWTESLAKAVSNAILKDIGREPARVKDLDDYGSSN